MTPWVVASALLGSVGLFVHNLADLPGQSMLSVEPFIPLLITCALVGLWFSRLRTGAAWLLLAWGILNLAGAIITVLPLAILPRSTRISRWSTTASTSCTGSPSFPSSSRSLSGSYGDVQGVVA